MNLFKRISYKETFGNYVFLFLGLFVMNNSFAMTPGENSYLDKSEEIDNKFWKFSSQNLIKYNQYDKQESQFKIFFGYDSENPENTFYPDLLIINDSNYIRELYRKKLNHMTINKKIYSINK